MATISVIIPNFNRADLIGETLENILRQSRKADEVIVVDDGSTDDSVDEILGFGNRIHLIRQENSGPGAARNRGLSVATGDYIQFFDSDDLCSLNKLEVQAAALDSSDADFAYGPWIQTRLEDGFARYPELALQQRALPADRSALSWFLRGWVIVFQCCMFRRTLLERVGPYREDLVIGEDSELLFRMLFAGARGIHTPEALVVYRLHFGAQISRGGMAEARRAEIWLKYARVISDALQTQPQAVSRSDHRQWDFVLWDALRQSHALSGAPGGLPPIGRATELAFAAKKTLNRLRAGFARRSKGSSFTRPYGPAALDAAQEDLIRALGYEPVRDRARSG